ncbi:hypothetical protein PAXRUDRAFT_821997 [Paxillus rubicundulus Ve08.2h10]|uniref:DUF4211 domain-containing protein n=1 Tax=Paxillus rubicundulus Ve08.2h10 TaxID=930991 RepID=A0A0D0E5S0_9AGAM|nr:hypothetical protein PAXRUDRAFT_821997 [Paxillus rubicundulus Ve08.2h10]
MTRRDKASQSSKKYEQKTLIDFLNSSPPSSPGPSKRKREPIPPPTHPEEVVSGSEDSDVGAIHFDPEILDVSDEDQSPRRPKRRKSIVVVDTVPEHELSDDSLEENIKVSVRWKGKKGKAKTIYDSEEDVQPRRRKLIKGVRPPTPEEQSVLDEVDENQILESRFRARGKMSAFQRNLEKFKSLKGKKHNDLVLESESSEAEVSVAPFKGAKPHRSGESSPASYDSDDSLEDDEDDFIVDDDAHGAPTKLPVAFSMNTHQDLTHHFKIICQLFVHMAVRPLSERCLFLKHVLKDEEYFSVPLQATRRKLSGMRDSLVASSVWRSEFKKALETYPEFTLVRMSFAIPQCDACHLGGRLSTLLGRVGGEPYDVYDFEDMSDKESNEDSDEDEDADRKRDVKREFHLGRFCATRARVYHQFNHWEHSLYKSLQQEITYVQDKNHKFIKVAYVGGIEPPKDLYDADKVMDWLDQRGVIDIEWQKVRQMMDSARNLEMSAKRQLIDGAES